MLSEEEKLQETVFKNSDKFLKFVLLTIHRGALTLGQSENDSDDGTDRILQDQSLNMALTLLSFKVLDEKLVDIDDWAKLREGLDDLQILEKNHNNAQIKKTSRSLRKIIATHGVIVDHKVI